MAVLKIIILISVFIGFFAISFYILTFSSAMRRNSSKFKDSELPFATVIIPAWNEEKSIKSTLESILASEYPKFEVIFVDDGSTDKTLEIAKQFEIKGIRVFTKKNGGKASALNFGIKKAKGEIIFTMDADTKVDVLSMKKMARYFKNEKVMSVTPAMLIDNPNTILRRMQHIEYLLGIFLRKVFATLNAIYIAPGAFTVYRKKFFDKYGDYDENNITEDLEMALRIQSKGYLTENCPTANIYTLGPPNFRELSKQRIRWYYGLIRNFWNYRFMVSRDFADLGLLVLPVGWLTILFAIFILISSLFKGIFKAIDYFSFLNSINFNFGGLFNYTWLSFEKFFFEFLSEPIVIFLGFSLVTVFVYLKYAEIKTGKIKHLKRNLFVFFVLFGPLFCYWWSIAFFKNFFNKKINWR